MICGLGTDLVDVSRFERFTKNGNDALLNRLFTKEENDYCRPKVRSYQHFACRFAAKEAFFKALGTGLREGMSWHDVAVANDEQGKPLLLVTGQAAAICAGRGIDRWLVSLSHDGGYAAATVLLESREQI